MQALLFGVDPADARVFSAAVLLSLLMALAGSIAPRLARRARRSDYRDPGGVRLKPSHGITETQKHGRHLCKDLLSKILKGFRVSVLPCFRVCLFRYLCDFT